MASIVIEIKHPSAILDSKQLTSVEAVCHELTEEKRIKLFRIIYYRPIQRLSNY